MGDPIVLDGPAVATPVVAPGDLCGNDYEAWTKTVWLRGRCGVCGVVTTARDNTREFVAFIQAGVCYGCERKWQLSRGRKPTALRWVAQCRLCRQPMEQPWEKRGKFEVCGWVHPACEEAERNAWAARRKGAAVLKREREEDEAWAENVEKLIKIEQEVDAMAAAGLFDSPRARAAAPAAPAAPAAAAGAQVSEAVAPALPVLPAIRTGGEASGSCAAEVVVLDGPEEHDGALGSAGPGAVAVARVARARKGKGKARAV